MSKREMPKSSSLMRRIRPSDLNNGKTTPWKFNPMEVAITSDLPQASTLDGGKCSV
jgi:hypothetical protein